MPRGRQYYDPILQAPSRVDTPGQRRIELYPEGDIRDNAERPKWVARLIGEDGLIVQHSPGSFDHDDAMRQAQEMWPGLEIFELREESEDSTHEGMGPSPRLWQQHQVFGEPKVQEEAARRIPPAVHEQPDQELVSLQILPITEPGIYIRLRDICGLLEIWAKTYEEANNPSGALALRESIQALHIAPDGQVMEDVQ